jgi:hypothetical protein
MQFKTPIEEFLPEIQDFIKQFIRKARAPNFEVIGNFAVQYSHDVARYKQVAFKDPRFPQVDEFVGSVTWNSSEQEWTVQSRTVENQKFRSGNADRKRKKTKDLAKVLKLATDHITPFEYREVMARSDKAAIHAIRTWRAEGNRYGGIFSDATGFKTLYEEVKRLRDMGITFITPAFQKIADEGLDLYELNQARRKTYVRKHHVLFIDHGRVVVSVQDVDGNDFNDAFHGSKVYESFEQLPEEIAMNVGMLKMLSDGERLPDVGVRVSTSEYFVLIPLDPSPKA